MEVSVTDAKGQLTELVRRAEAGDEVILTRHGHPAVRLVPVRTVASKAARRKLIEQVRTAAALKAIAGPDVALHVALMQEFLYGQDGLPR